MAEFLVWSTAIAGLVLTVAAGTLALWVCFGTILLPVAGIVRAIKEG